MPFHQSMIRNVIYQSSVLSGLMRERNAALEFNCNPVGCFRSGWDRVITVHDLYFDVMPEHYRRRHRLWWRLLFPRCLGAASAVVCVSRNTQADLERFYPNFAGKAVVVHEAGMLAAAAAPTHPSGAPEAPYVLYVGNISPNKNPDVLVRAIKRLEQRGLRLRVRHVGRDDAGLLADAQRRAGLGNAIEPTGMLSDAELADAYRHASCLVNTSLYEGFCLPIVEAQSLGVPVICSDIPVLREVAGEAAAFFPPSDDAVLAERLAAVSADAELRRRMGEASRDNAARFSWSRAAAETEAVFDAVLMKGIGRDRAAGQRAEALESIG